MACPPRRSTTGSRPEASTLQEKIAQLLAESADERIAMSVGKKSNGKADSTN
jgi:hypothetical protein